MKAGCVSWLPHLCHKQSSSKWTRRFPPHLLLLLSLGLALGNNSLHPQGTSQAEGLSADPWTQYLIRPTVCHSHHHSHQFYSSHTLLVLHLHPHQPPMFTWQGIPLVGMHLSHNMGKPTIHSWHLYHVSCIPG